MKRTAPTCLFALGAVALIACSTLPEHAAPRGRVLDRAEVDASDVIGYRTLERADFKGSQPPPELVPYVETLGAATCAHIFTTPDTEVMVQAQRASDGRTTYRATAHHLRFSARMDRACSWWNPRDVGLPRDYILEHEQIHFAIVELEARRLNTSGPEIEAHLNATADSAEVAARAAERQLQDEIRRRMKDILKRSRQFDEDTSMGHKPEQQKRWWKLVSSELAASDD